MPVKIKNPYDTTDDNSEQQDLTDEEVYRMMKEHNIPIRWIKLVGSAFMAVCVVGVIFERLEDMDY